MYKWGKPGTGKIDCSKQQEKGSTYLYKEGLVVWKLVKD